MRRSLDHALHRHSKGGEGTCDERHRSEGSLGSVGIQREFMTAAAILIMAAKL